MADEPLTPERLRKEIDLISRLSGYGDFTAAQSQNLWGVDHIGVGAPTPSNRESYGLTFFTRPDLNLSYDNLNAHRIMSPMQILDKFSMAQLVRNTLSPRLAGDLAPESTSEWQVKLEADKDSIGSMLADPKQAFIPILTNKLESLSGWPDIAVDTYTSQEGIRKEAYSMVDSTVGNFATFDLTANFNNVFGDPITYLFTIWVYYSSLVYQGIMVPWPDYIVSNRFDYNTRIYRLVLDERGHFVQKIGACGAAFPMASPLGASFNFSSEGKFNRENDTLSIPFRCIGFDYLDPILVQEFNDTVADFNPDMKPGNRDGRMVLLDPSRYANNEIYQTVINATNFFSYPRVNPDTMAMEWWVEKSFYQKVLLELNDKGIFNS